MEREAEKALPEDELGELQSPPAEFNRVMEAIRIAESNQTEEQYELVIGDNTAFQGR